MTEPRARQRAKGASVFHGKDLEELLYAFGDPSFPPLTTTTSALDEILTDFIIETCHSAAVCASYSRRQKIKVDDFRWVLRKNPMMLGRIQEQLFREKWLKSQRKAMDLDGMAKEGVGGNAERLQELADEAGVGQEGTVKGKGRGKGRRKRKADDMEDDRKRKKSAV